MPYLNVAIPEGGEGQWWFKKMKILFKRRLLFHLFQRAYCFVSQLRWADMCSNTIWPETALTHVQSFLTTKIYIHSSRYRPNYSKLSPSDLIHTKIPLLTIMLPHKMSTHMYPPEVYIQPTPNKSLKCLLTQLNENIPPHTPNYPWKLKVQFKFICLTSVLFIPFWKIPSFEIKRSYRGSFLILKNIQIVSQLKWTNIFSILFIFWEFWR